MLLDRRRVKFWQKWVFGVMAILMAAFLLMIPLSGQSCGGGSTNGVSDELQQEIDRYEAAVKVDPADAQAWRDLGDAYVTSVSAQHQQGAAFTDQETANLTRATVAYRRAAKLLGEEKGAEAKALRLETLETLASVYATMGDYERATSIYGQLTELQPRNADYFFGMGNAAINAGDTTSARLAFQRFLELAPDDPAAPDVKAWIKQNAPSPAPTEGTGQ